MSWEHAHALVEPLAAGLTGLGVEPEDKVVILSRTRVDWVLVDLAVLCAGATTVAVHPGGTPEVVARHIDGNGAVVVVAEDVDQADTLRRVRGDIRTVRKVVLFDGDYPDHRVMTFEELLAQGEEVLRRVPGDAERIDALRPEVLATVLHPPGGDATPAGERRTHAACVREGRAAERGEGLRHSPPRSTSTRGTCCSRPRWSTASGCAWTRGVPGECARTRDAGSSADGDRAGNLPA